MDKSYNIFKIKNSPIIYNLNICIFKFNIFIRRIFGDGQLIVIEVTLLFLLIVK